MESKFLKFEDIPLGMSAGFEIAITLSMLEDFAKFSGDFNPLHTDRAFAEKSKFKKQIAHGFLASSFLSRLIGMHIPGKSALYLSQTLNFKKPVFIGDHLFVEGKVIEKSETLKLLTLRTTISKSTGEIAIDGEAKVLCEE